MTLFRPFPNPRQYLTLNGRVSWPFFVLAGIVVVALVLRLHGINWDDGYGFHPDERDIYFRSDCMYALLTDAPHADTCGYLVEYPEAEPGLGGLRAFFNAERSPLNPHWFPLGSILIYVLVFFRSVIELFTDIGGLEMRYVGRTLSALADVGSVLMVFVLGRRLYGRNAGLLAAGLTALAVIHVQHSHFYRPETFTVLLTLASIWATLRMVQKGRLRDSALLGLMLGLALSPKVNVLPLLAPLALGYFYRVLDEAEGRWSDITPEILQKIAGHALLAGAVALAVFFVTTPYAFIDVSAFVGDVMLQTRMARNAGLFPFTVQYVDTPAFLYQIKQTVVWGLGVPLGVVAWLSIPFTVALVLYQIKTGERRHIRADLLLLAWVVPSLLFLESFEVRFLRYLFPLMPVMILLASRMMLWEMDKARQLARRLAAAGRSAGRAVASKAVGEVAAPALLAAAVAVPVFVVGSTAFYSLAFQRVYSNDHPALEASRWVLTEVPRGAPIVMDNHWDEWLPGLYSYDIWQFPVYEPDTQTKMRTLAGRLSRSDYLIFYSHRPYASAVQDPERFPYSNNYYRLLFSGELGYRLHRDFTSYPSLGGVVFRDDALAQAGLESPPLTPPLRGGSNGGAPPDANFTLNLGYADDNVVGYDHPRVLVFRNVDRLDESSLRGMLAPPLTPLLRGGIKRGEQTASSSGGLMLSPEALDKQRGGGTYSDIVNRDGWTNDVPVLSWLLVVELIYLLTLPLAFFIFRPLPDRGILLARILGLLAVCYVAWLIVSLGWIDFSRGAVYVGMGVMAVVSGVALWFVRGEVWEFVRARWRLLAFSECLFLAAFLAFVVVRYFNPDLWHPYRGGEKPMELAYFTAVFRSTTLPPFDPWFAGGYLNYYYWGYFVIACVTRVAAIVPTTAFNLAVPLFFALTVTGAFSLGYNLAAGVQRAGIRRRGEDRTASPAIAPPLKVGIKGGVRMLPPVVCGLAAALFTAVIGNLDGMVQIVQGAWGKAVDGVAWAGFDFWRSSRMIPPLDSFEPPALAFWLPDFIPGDAGSSWHITEFPFFTFLFADLHAHMMVIPFTLLALGLGLCLVAGLRNGGVGWTVAVALALAVSLGALWAINSWDYPSYVILTLGLTAVAALFTRGSPRRKLTLFAVLGAGMAAVSLLSFWPFHQYYETFNNGLDASRWRTPIDRFLAIHALFIFVIATYLIVRTRRDLAALARSIQPTLPFLPQGAKTRESPPEIRWLRLIVAPLIVAGILLGILGYWNGLLLVTLLLLATVAGWRALQSPEPSRPYEAMALAMVAMAAFIAIGVDLVTVEGDIGRMNTLFKYYLEVWVFLAIAAAYMLWRLGSSWLPSIRPGAATVWLFVLALLIGSSLIYTALGTRDRVADKFADLPPTLDGTAYMAVAEHWERDEIFPLIWDYHAIRWLQDNVQGSPVVLEAHMDQYRWGGRIANYTGLPTVIGWPWHQIQQRFGYREQVGERAAHVRLAYETTDADLALTLMKRYGVSYIVVGELERLNYRAQGLAKFEAMAETGTLTKVYENEGTAIFRTEFP